MISGQTRTVRWLGSHRGRLLGGWRWRRGVSEVGSGMNHKRRKFQRILADPTASPIAVEHRDRLARFGVENLEPALSAQGQRVVVVDPGETDDDLVRDMTEALTSFCARLYGRPGPTAGRPKRLCAKKCAKTLQRRKGHGIEEIYNNHPIKEGSIPWLQPSIQPEHGRSHHW